MSTSWRNKVFGGIAWVFLGMSGLRAQPIDTINVIFNDTPNYTAGVSTSSSGGTLIVTCSRSGANPDEPELVTLSLIQNSTVIPGGMSTLTFTTVNTSQNYLGTAFPGGPQSFTFYYAGSNLRLRASTANGVSDVSNPFTVLPNAAGKLVVYASGQSHDPGKDPNVSGNIGRSGTADVQQPGQAFSFTVIQTDNWFNRVTGGTPLLSFASGDLVTLPGSNTLDNDGEESYNATIIAARTTRTITVSAAGLASGSVEVRTDGPEKEQVFPYPSPFNPQLGSPMGFRFQLNDAASVTLIVKDRFGQDVWSRGISGVRGPNEISWDGRNENGHVVSAGVYYALLQVGNQVKSKKAFGVVK